MKRFFFIAACIVSLLTAAAGETRNITILEFVNTTGNESGTTMTETTHRIIASSVKFIGTFRILPAPTIKIGTDISSLKEYARVTGSEYILFGALSEEKNGALALENDLYCRTDDSVFRAQEKIENALDIFSAADTLALKILSELHKTKIAYGTLSVKTDRDTGKYDVYINDVLAGSNCTSIANIPDGEKTISVVSRAEATGGKVLFSGTVAIKPNGTTPIAVTMPKTDPRLEGKTDKGLLTVTSEPAGISVCMDGEAIMQTPATFETTKGTHTIEVLATCVKDRYYKNIPTRDITVNAGEETVVPLKLEPAQGILDYSYLTEGVSFSLDGVDIPIADEKSVKTQAGFYMLSVVKNGKIAVFEQAWIKPDETYMVPWGQSAENSFIVPVREIAFKGDSDSWDGITAVYRSDKEKIVLGSEKYSVTAIKLARDGKYFYWHVEFRELNPLVSVPPDMGGGATVSLRIGEYQTMKLLYFSLGSGNSKKSWYRNMKNQSDTGMTKPDVVTNANSFTGKIALTTLAKNETAVPHAIMLNLEGRNSKYSTYLNVGFTDFSFLEQN